MSLYNSKKEQKLYCYSHCLFDREMEKNGWLPDGGFPNSGVAIISICSPNDDDSEHWFLNDMNPDRILNIDFDDVSPEMWWDSNSRMDYYDMSYLALSDGKIEESRKPFNHHYTSKFTNNEIYYTITIAFLYYILFDISFHFNILLIKDYISLQ